MTGERQRWASSICAVLVAMAVLAGCASPPTEDVAAAPAVTEVVKANVGRMPVSFVANHGRWDPQVSWVASGAEATAYFVDGGVRWALAGEQGGWALDQMLVGARPSRPTASAGAPGTVSYFGDKPATGLPTATELRVDHAWPGVDVVWSGTGGHIEAIYHLAPGADPAQVRVAWKGADSVDVTPDGRLSVATPLRTFEEDAPKAFQHVDGRRVPVDVAYELHGTGTYGFRLGAYDPASPLVIDPAVLLYAGFLGGTAEEVGEGIAVDGAGNAYVAGSTISSGDTFPETTGAFQADNGGGRDAFVAKVNASGSALLYATFLGGTGDDVADAVAVDGAGRAHVTGYTTSGNFPTANAFDATFGGVTDAFVTKLGPTGTALVYSSYLGGSGDDTGRGIAVDAAGNAQVTGRTTGDFPTANAFDATFGGITDAFVTKLNPAGSALLFSTYLGGSATDTGTGIAVDASGRAYVAGSTLSADFPTADAFDATNSTGADGFLAKLDATGSALVYSTYLGGSADDDAFGVAVDGAGNAYVTGHTRSADFPAVNAFDATFGGIEDAFVAKVNPAGSGLIYSTYLGGSGADLGLGVAADVAGNAHVTGYTTSFDFPTANPFQATKAGGVDAFVAKLNAAGSAFVYSTYLGGGDDDIGHAVAVDGAGNTHVTGTTFSTAATFPATSGVFQPATGGFADAFVAKIADAAVPAGPGITTSATPGVTLGGAISDTATVAGTAASPPPTGTVTFRLYGPDNTSCTGTAVFVSQPQPLAGGPPPTANSGNFTPAVPGTYRWVASYSGDLNYPPATADCNAPNQTSVVHKATPTLSTQASAGGLVGTAVHDVASVTGGVHPTGTVTFFLYGDAACTTLLFTSAARPLAGSTATSASFTPDAPGTYYWTAIYNGDANNNTVSAGCGAPNESVTITPFQAPPSTRTLTGDVLGPVTVNQGESVLITNARVVGPVTVNPAGALTVVNSQISRGVTANAPSFFSMCGTRVSGPSPATALSVTGAPVPIRVGDPATGCAGNLFAGQVVLSGNLGVTFGANTVSHNATIDDNGSGDTVVKANRVFGTLGCAGNSPAPTNAGQVNTAGTTTGQCAAR